MGGSDQKSGSKWTGMSWLHVLFWITTGLCGLQIAAGMAAHSLALLGDSVHALLDVLSYGVAILTENMKKRRSGNKRQVAVIDLTACLVSIFIVCYASYFVCDEAIARLYLDVHPAATVTPVDALATPTVEQAELPDATPLEHPVTTEWSDTKIPVASVSEHLAATEDAGGHAATPLATPVEHEGVKGFVRSERRANILMADPLPPVVRQAEPESDSAGEEAASYANVMKSLVMSVKDEFAGHKNGEDHGKPVTVDGRLMFFFSVLCMVCNGWLAWVGYTDVVASSSGEKQGWLDWLHGISHAGGNHGPACGQSCGHGGSNSNGEGPGGDFFSQKNGKKKKSNLCSDYQKCGDSEVAAKAKIAQDIEVESTNLNLTLQWLHVLTDALRGVVLFIASLCIMMKWVDPSAADAGVAVVVVATVVLGSLSLLPAAFSSAKDLAFPAKELYGDFAKDLAFPAQLVQQIKNA